MDKLIALALVINALTCLVCKSDAKCEEPASFPVNYYGSDRYLCFIYYRGLGHSETFLGCNGDTYQIAEDHSASAEEGKGYGMGSLIVKAGCTFYGFEDQEFQGTRHVHDGPIIIPKVVTGFHMDAGGDGFPSYYCECQMNHINCIPTDGFEVVVSCDATSAQVDTICRYRKTIGTAFTTSISDSMSIDSTIEASMKAQFFGLFEATLSASVTTGYDWTSTSEEAKNEEVTIEVEAVAPAGLTLIIEQAVGFCDGSTVKTEMYKITQQKANGEIIESKLVHWKDL